MASCIVKAAVDGTTDASTLTLAAIEEGLCPKSHLTERLEAIKSARAAFVRLYPTLGDVQKQDRRCDSPAPDRDFLTRDSAPRQLLNYK